MVPLQSIKVSAVWEMLGIDLTGPLPTTQEGYKYIFTATDYFSKWVEAFHLKTKSAAEVAQKLCSIIYRFGCPKLILSEREFVNELNTKLCDLLGIERSVTAAYHPQTNGLDEKTNHSIKRALMKVVNERQNNWDIYLEATLFSLRSKPHCSTKYSPFRLMYGREAVFPAEVPADIPLSIVLPEEDDVESYINLDELCREECSMNAAGNITQAQQKQGIAYGKRKLKKYKGFTYAVGQEVLLFNCKKQGRKGGRLEPDFTGPYAIREIDGKRAILANAEGDLLKKKYNLDHVKPYKRDCGPPKKRMILEEDAKEKATRPSVLMYAPPHKITSYPCGHQMMKAMLKLWLGLICFMTSHLEHLQVQTGCQMKYLMHISICFMKNTKWAFTI